MPDSAATSDQFGNGLRRLGLHSRNDVGVLLERESRTLVAEAFADHLGQRGPLTVTVLPIRALRAATAPCVKPLSNEPSATGRILAGDGRTESAPTCTGAPFVGVPGTCPDGCV